MTGKGLFDLPGEGQNRSVDPGAGNWLSNQYAVGRPPESFQSAQPSYQVAQCDTFCPQQAALERRHMQLCVGTAATGTVAGAIGGAKVGQAAGTFVCGLTPIPTKVCGQAGGIAGAMLGGYGGFSTAMQQPSCQYIVDASGKCCDANHKH